MTGVGTGRDHRPFAAALVTLAFAAAWASSVETLSDFHTRAIAVFGLVVFLLLCRLSPTLLAGIALAGAFVTLTPVVVVYYSAAGSVFSDTGPVAEAFGRTVDAALLSGWLLLLLRIPSNVVLALVTAAVFTTAYLVHAGLWSPAPAVVFLLCAASGFALFVAFRGAGMRLFEGRPGGPRQEPRRDPDDRRGADHRPFAAAALVTLALVVVASLSAPSDFGVAEALGWPVDAALLVSMLTFALRGSGSAAGAYCGRAWARRGPANALVSKTFAAALVALGLAVTYASSVEAFSDFDTRTIAAMGGTFYAALFLIPTNTLLTLVTVGGVTTAYLVFTDLWAAAPAVVVLLCAASGFALFVAFRVIDDRPWAGWLSAAALAVLAAVLVGRADPHVEPVYGDVSNIRDVSLSRTPNLYFISFDSLVPRALLKKYFDVETTGFHALFDAKFRRFPNFFVNATPTRPALYTALALDPQVHNSQTAGGRDPGTFSGQSPSPLLGILRGNGYETSTFFDMSYFGRRKGPWVDNYAYFRYRTLCTLLDEAVRPWAFWGYCRWFQRQGNHYPAYLERITSVDPGGEPQFTMAHLYIPGHTDGNSYRYGDSVGLARYRAHYLRSIERAADYLDRIVRHVEEDPDAILLVYGDHGMLLSHGMEFDDDPEFFIQDRYGVLGGVFPPDACAPWFDAAAAPGWMTLLDAVHAVLSCLSSDGKGALVEPRAYVIDPGGHPAMRPPSGYRRSPRYVDFDDFLYE